MNAIINKHLELTAMSPDRLDKNQLPFTGCSAEEQKNEKEKQHSNVIFEGTPVRFLSGGSPTLSIIFKDLADRAFR